MAENGKKTEEWTRVPDPHRDGDRRPRTPFRLRAHHLGCTAGFTGHGYHADFTAHLARIAEVLAADPDHPIQVVDGPDDLCGPCPHLQAGVCRRDPGAEARVRAHDQEFLQALDLKVGSRTSPREVATCLARDPEARRRIGRSCAGCPWTAVCAFLKRWNRD